MFVLDEAALERVALDLLARPAIQARFRALFAPAAEGATSEQTYATLTQFAKLHGVSVRSVRRWVRLGLPAHRVGKRSVRIRLREGSAWVESGAAIVAKRPRKSRTGRTNHEAEAVPRPVLERTG